MRRALGLLIPVILITTVALVARRDSAIASGGALLHTLDAPGQVPDPYGGSLTASGDVDGDGMADTIVGSPGEDVGPNSSQGRAYVFSGADASLLFALDTPDPQAGGHFGSSVAAGDVDHDGKADVIVAQLNGAGLAQQTRGRAFVFSGADGSLLYTLDSPNAQDRGAFGSSLAAGDVDLDGKADVVVGAQGEGVGANVNQGRTYVFSGADGSPFYALTTPNPQTKALFGNSVAVGDVNGDGAADILVGAELEAVAGVADQGRAYIFSGADGSLLRTFTPPPGAGGNFADSVASGDVNGDGRADAVLGSLSGGGHVLVFSGVDGSLLHHLLPNGLTEFGNKVAAGDVDGDGNADIIAGAWRRDVGANQWQGRAYAFSGADGSLLLALTTPDPAANAYFGVGVAAGAVEPDGRADVIVVSAQQKTYIFAGGDSADTDGDGCPDAWESLQSPQTDPADPWDFFSVPVPALFAAPDPTVVFRGDVVSSGAAQAVFAYFKKGAKTGSTEYEQDLNLNGIRDGLEYDRSVVGPGQSGPPDGTVSASDSQLAFAQFKLRRSCNNDFVLP